MAANSGTSQNDKWVIGVSLGPALRNAVVYLTPLQKDRLLCNGLRDSKMDSHGRTVKSHCSFV